jgi:methylthioribose-1-phosphate isomerase
VAAVTLTHTCAVDTPTLRWVDPPEGPAVELLDQTRLPAEEKAVRCGDVPALIDAIRRLVVRGAPMLGLAGAYGVALAAYRGDDVAAAADALTGARPTAVNLSLGARRTRDAYERACAAGTAGDEHEAKRFARAAALAEARAMHEEDAEACAGMARHGLPLIPERARILTHCNTGALVTGGEGTAFGIVRAAHRAGRVRMLWVDETRPLLQGARLTAWEAQHAGIAYAVLPDAAAASLLAAGEVDIVLVGADRIAADGSVANKIGTYGLAVLARHHGVPFVVAAPVSTIDLSTPDGASIVVEHRPADEVNRVRGIPIAPEGGAAYNPAFDVTPAELVSAIVTERGTAAPPGPGSLRLLCAGPQAGTAPPSQIAPGAVFPAPVQR